MFCITLFSLDLWQGKYLKLEMQGTHGEMDLFECPKNFMHKILHKKTVRGLTEALLYIFNRPARNCSNANLSA